MNTLENLARLCQSVNLGADVTASNLSPFTVNFQQLHRVVTEVCKGETREMSRIIDDIIIRESNELETEYEVI